MKVVRKHFPWKVKGITAFLGKWMVSGRRNHVICENDGFDLKSLKAAWEHSELVLTHGHFCIKDLGRQVQILLKVQFCVFGTLKWRSSSSFCPFQPCLSLVSANPLVTFPCAAGEVKFMVCTWTFLVKNFLNPLPATQGALNNKFLPQREVRPWPPGITVKPDKGWFPIWQRHHLCIVQTSGTGLASTYPTRQPTVGQQCWHIKSGIAQWPSVRHTNDFIIF